MSWRFRQSFTIIPGLRLNLSKSGLSASIGGAPFTLNIGANGMTGAVSIPGTGLSYRHHIPIGNDSNGGEGNFTPVTMPSSLRPASASAVQQIHSASTELLTSESLKELKHLIQTAFQQGDEIVRDLNSTLTLKAEAEHRFLSWDKGFLFKRVFKSAFAKRKEIFETETAKVAELEEQRRLTKIITHIEIESEQAELYYRLRDEFAALCECAATWDIKTAQATDKFRERTTASTRLSRERVTFGLGACDLIQWDQKVPNIKNAKGGDFFLYPGFILYRAAREAFSLIQYHDVKGNAALVSFQEEDGVPSDSQVIGQTWAKANKDGSRDRRFVENCQIPIAQYGSVTLKSDHGLWEEFEFSNPQRLFNFLKVLNEFTNSFSRVAAH